MPRRSSPSPLLNLPLLIVTLPIIGLLLLFLVVPSLLSSTSHKIRPASVKNGWDSLNILLVLFAILCGIFARRNDDESPANEDDHGNSTTHSYNVSRVVQGKAVLQPQQSPWFDDPLSSDQKIFDNSPMFGTTRIGRLKRSSSSYPDLRQESSFWETREERLRFFDDFGIDKYRSPPASSDYDSSHRRQRSLSEESNVKEIQVDTFILRSSTLSSSPPPPPPPPPPQRTYEAVSRRDKKLSQNNPDRDFTSCKTPPPAPPPPPKSTDHNQKRTHEVSHGERKVSRNYPDHGYRSISTPPPSPPPPPPPPPRRAPPTPPVAKAKVSDKNGRRKSSAAKEIKMVFASVLNSQRKRRRKQKTKSASCEDELHFPPEPNAFTVPPPPPPPPPPPSVFHNLFRKGSKTKRIHSFHAPTPPPPPPPPPPSMYETQRSSKNKNRIPAPPPPAPPPKPSRRQNSSTTGRPPLPTRINNFYEETVNNGAQSPLIPMPPPPPPPPFRVPGFQFVMRGDYVKIRSGHSSRCSSPDLDEVDNESTERVNLMDSKAGSTVSGPISCPSPDVNIKADTFIARLKDGWRLEKINSMKEKGDMAHGPNRA